MLPPMLPVSVVPVTSQLDPARQKPDIPPVVPVQAGSNESTIDLKKGDAEQSTFLLREEQRRQQEQQKRRREADVERAPVGGTALGGDVVAALKADARREIGAGIAGEQRGAEQGEEGQLHGAEVVEGSGGEASRGPAFLWIGASSETAA